MANQQDAEPERRVRRRRRSYGELESEKPRKSQSTEQVTYEPEVPELRTARVQRLERSQSQTRTAAISTMTAESSATLQSVSTSKHGRRRHTSSASHGQKHRRRRKSTIKEDGPTDYVYDDHEKRSGTSRVQPIEPGKLREETSSSDTEEEQRIRKEEAKVSKPRKIRVIYITEEEDRIARRKDRRLRDSELSKEVSKSEESVRRSRASPSKRRSSVESPPIALSKSSTSRNVPADSRPGVKRRNTTTSHVSAKAPQEPSLNGASTKRASFIGSFFGPPAKQHQEPEKLVECLTCLSDDIPRSKSAKLKCGHRMCHSCLRRIFKLSVTDPQHMPPKCCTADHIPLKHVERLFDINFKKLWNKKFQEYSTKNRIYCPGRRCGEWIKPGNIHKEDGRKYGKCSRCKTKVCCLCNGKWHGTKECPKDEETNRLLATAKDEGWQRCYNCRTMVELKEGCNHMTCHCTAEFCMICGLKWKTCNCPWFNYDAVEADRLDHMRVPVPVAVAGEVPPQRAPRLRRQRPPGNYRDEITERRRQERMDEELARRLQRADIHDNGDDDYQGGIGDIHGIGNGAGHFMNQDYVRAAQNILTGTFDQATAAANYVMGVAQARGRPPPPPGPRRMAGRYPVAESPPLQRRHSERARTRDGAHEDPPAARNMPHRTATDYENAPGHASTGRNPQLQENTRPSVLAGLGDRRGGNRVSAWRRHVEPGVTPAEGLLST